MAIAARSPVAVQGTKVNLLYSRDHPVPDSLRFMVSPPRPPPPRVPPRPHPTKLPSPPPQAAWNMSMLQTDDILKSVQAAMEKKGPEAITYSKL